MASLPPASGARELARHLRPWQQIASAFHQRYPADQHLPSACTTCWTESDSDSFCRWLRGVTSSRHIQPNTSRNAWKQRKKLSLDCDEVHVRLDASFPTVASHGTHQCISDRRSGRQILQPALAQIGLHRLRRGLIRSSVQVLNSDRFPKHAVQYAAARSCIPPNRECCQANLTARGRLPTLVAPPEVVETPQQARGVTLDKATRPSSEFLSQEGVV